MKKNQHVTPKGNQWQVIGANNSKATRVTNTQKQAIAIATKIAKNNHSEVVVHGRSGKIRDKDSYGNDPHPPRDLKY